ncbi:FAD-dependent oxidoreductase [Bilifractor sp. HCP3S3_D3]|uniref:FAD-dependent oxidoreductase n=1 Tax=Bilifractor sp. HCP3S3_D3 TaxID=3438907 RepID=UPI003F8A4887
MPVEKKNFYDAVVIGGGPAGLTAGLYLARACYRVLVVEKETFGGQITITSEVVNFPGSGPVSGRELTERMRKQAEAFGCEFMSAEVTSLNFSSKIRKVETDKGTLECLGVILATGAHPRMIGFRGEAEYKGHGVAYCATCDGEFFSGKEIFVIGGGFAAAEESVFLTKYASHVTILIREDDFTCAKSAADTARSNNKITVLTNTEVESVTGDSVLRTISWKNIKNGKRTVYTPENGDTFGVFVFAGYLPSTELIRNLAELNEQGYVVTDRNQKTSAEGLYAAGDVCIKPLRQVVTATGDGALAATELEKYISVMQQKTGRKAERPAARASVHKVVDSGTDSGEGSGVSRQTGLLSDEIRQQLSSVFAKMEKPLILELHSDNRPVSEELKSYMDELAGQTDKLSVIVSDEKSEDTPFVRILQEDHSPTGLAFHGVPGGHEFTSFVLGLYNASGPGQAIDPELREKIAGIKRDIHMQILVSLSCTMCPELVTAAQRIASLNPLVSAEVYDLNHFGELKQKYNVMSVPCLVINGGEKILFGKKNIPQLLNEL